MNSVISLHNPLPFWQGMTATQAFENPAIAFDCRLFSQDEADENKTPPPRHGGVLRMLWQTFREAVHWLPTAALPVTAFANPAVTDDWSAGRLAATAPRKDETVKFFERRLRQPRAICATQQAASWYEHAQVYCSTGQFAKALECAEQALFFDAQNGAAWQLCGAALLELQRCEEALQAFQHAVNLHPREIEAWLGCGRAQMQMGLFEAALQSFNHALAQAPDNATVLLYQARAHLQLQHYQQACLALARVVTLRPAEADCWRAYGEALARNNQLNESLECYVAITQLQPADADNWVKLGSLLRELGHVPEAVASYNIALDLAPHDFYIWFSRGLALADLGRHEDAARSFHRALEFNLTDAAAQYHLALSYLPRFLEALAQGHVFNAKELWQRAVKLGRQGRSADWFVQELYYLQVAAEMGHHRLVKVLISRLEDNELLSPLHCALDWLLTETPPPAALSETLRKEVEALKKRFSPPADQSLAAFV